MKAALQGLGWFFLGLNGVALLFVLGWAFTASEREGERSYAIVFLLLLLVYASVGGAALAFSARRRSLPGLWCSTLFLGLLPVGVAALRIINSL